MIGYRKIDYPFQGLGNAQNILLFSSPSKMLHTRNFMCTQTPKKLDATLVPSLMILSMLHGVSIKSKANCLYHIYRLPDRIILKLSRYFPYFIPPTHPTNVA